MDSVFINGLALRNFRGIGDEVQYIAPFERFNLFIGENNSGKSCVLEFLSNYYVNCFASGSGSWDANRINALDIHQGSYNSQVLFSCGFPVDKVEDVIKEHIASTGREHRGYIEPSVRSVLRAISNDSYIWLKRNGSGFSLTNEPEPTALKSAIGHLEWSQLWSILTSQRNGNINQNWIPETIRRIVELVTIPQVKISIIPAIREISNSAASFEKFNGTGLIGKLAELQQPDVHERENKVKFDKINSFLKFAINNDTARIEIPHNRDHVLVEIDGKILPLKNLGTGIHEVVMIASFCTILEDQVICIEEPEIHLHPALQRRLMQFLQDKTSNQYFIATHSASLIDSVDASVFHVTNKNGSTYITSAISHKDRRNICDDLGYKASDILQSNFIIWVEGPSDRIYINHWIGDIAPELREGIEYSIMFYGGRLLSHLSTEQIDFSEEDAQLLISLRRINQNMCVVIDSDKSKSGAGINKTKSRIKRELENDSSFAWVTAGREIENYIPEKIMTAALTSAYPVKFKSRADTGQYDHVLPFLDTKGNKFSDVNKVEVAKLICMHPPALDVLDLKKTMNSLVAKIRSANHQS